MGLQALISLARPFQFRGKHRLFTHLAPRTGRVEAEVFGARMTLDLGDFIQRRLYLGAYAREETQTMRRCVGPGMCVVDVGANAGYFTALAATLVGPSGAVYADEPSAAAYAWLSAMIGRDGWTHVQSFHCGLAQDEAGRDLNLGDPGNHTPPMVAVGQKAIGRFQTRTLDGEAARLRWKRVDLMKVDVAGAGGVQRLLATGQQIVLRTVGGGLRGPGLRTGV